MSAGRHFYYRLDEHMRPIACALREMAKPGPCHQLAETFTANCRISTIFLGIDHGWRGPPVLFETMVFEKAGIMVEWPEGDTFETHEDLDKIRYCTYDEAMTGHYLTVKRFLKMEADAAEMANPKGRVS